MVRSKVIRALLLTAATAAGPACQLPSGPPSGPLAPQEQDYANVMLPGSLYQWREAAASAGQKVRLEAPGCLAVIRVLAGNGYAVNLAEPDFLVQCLTRRSDGKTQIYRVFPAGPGGRVAVWLELALGPSYP